MLFKLNIGRNWKVFKTSKIIHWNTLINQWQIKIKSVEWTDTIWGQITAIKTKQLWLKKHPISVMYMKISRIKGVETNQTYKLNEKCTSIYIFKYNEFYDTKHQVGTCQSVQSTIYIQNSRNQMNKYGICRNRYFSAFETNHCEKYRLYVITSIP